MPDRVLIRSAVHGSLGSTHCLYRHESLNDKLALSRHGGPQSRTHCRPARTVRRSWRAFFRKTQRAVQAWNDFLPSKKCQAVSRISFSMSRLTALRHNLSRSQAKISSSKGRARQDGKSIASAVVRVKADCTMSLMRWRTNLFLTSPAFWQGFLLVRGARFSMVSDHPQVVREGDETHKIRRHP